MPYDSGESESYKEWWKEEKAARGLAEAEIARLRNLAHAIAKELYNYKHNFDDTHPQWLSNMNAKIDGKA